MVARFISLLEQLDSLFWGYVGFVLILALGIYLTVKTHFFQLRAFPALGGLFAGFLKDRMAKESVGTHPLKVFFASVGGMIGIGNIVGVVTAVQFGGPGALFWIWIAALFGSLIKYAEIYLGLRYRVANGKGGYDGGPMYFLAKAFKARLLPSIVCGLLCVYGVEIYQFSVVTDSIVHGFHLDRFWVAATLLALVLWAGLGGVPRLGKICAIVMPFFMVFYVVASVAILGLHARALPSVLWSVLSSAFTGHAAIGGFAGSSFLLAVQHGLSRACYSADIGIGYDSIIQSESATIHPERQAGLAILGVVFDNLVCTLSILLVLVTGVWNAVPAVPASEMVQRVLSQHVPFASYFMPLFFLVVGYTTIIAYFSVGIKCARFLMPQWGMPLYYAYAACALLFFSFADQTHALLIMSLSGSLLLLINLCGIFRLRHDLHYRISKDATSLELSPDPAP